MDVRLRFYDIRTAMGSRSIKWKLRDISSCSKLFKPNRRFLRQLEAAEIEMMADAQTAHTPMPVPLVRVQDARPRSRRASHHGQARRRIGVLPHEVAHLSAAMSDQRENRRAGGLIGAVSAPLVGPPPGRVRRVQVGLPSFPVFWFNSSASKAGSSRTSVGSVSYRLFCTRPRSVCICLRLMSSSHASRAGGSPLVMPRSIS